MKTMRRKEDHIDVCLNFNVQAHVDAGFSDVHFIHNSIPELDFSEISVELEFFSKKLKAPFMIAGMTGGAEISKKINKNLAIAANELGIAMGVGSQRAMIENPALKETYNVREYAPEILLFSNLGLPQFLKGYTSKEAKIAVEEIGADVLAVHLNALQEIVQKEGDKNFSSGIEVLRKLKEECEFPIVAKETGAGISREVCEKLSFLDGFDVGGLGGTSFSAVEYYRNDFNGKELAQEFWDWGIQTTISIVECKGAKNLIATGGIRSGKDAAKAIALGADVCGIALPLLKEAMKSPKSVTDALKKAIHELKVSMFLCGCRNLKELKKAPLVITGFTRQWLEARGEDVKSFAER